MRELPPELAEALRRARELEAVAAEHSGLFSQRHAISSTASLMLAAVDAGWTTVELAAATGLSRTTIAKRIQGARQLHGHTTPGLVLDAPLSAPRRPRDILAQPVEAREWLTRSEAAAHAGCHPHTIYNWSRAGLLPNTRTGHKLHLFLRADIARAMGGARYNELGIHYAQLRTVIDRARI